MKKRIYTIGSLFELGSIVGGYGKGEAQGPYETAKPGTAGSGSAQSTAGPHDKDLLNKADPRVCPPLISYPSLNFQLDSNSPN